MPDPEFPFRYGPGLATDIELRWQERWAAAGVFHTPNPAGALGAGFAKAEGRPKFYVLDMFPYPSGTGLHVGHPLGFIGTDVFARYSSRLEWQRQDYKKVEIKKVEITDR